MGRVTNAPAMDDSKLSGVLGDHVTDFVETLKALGGRKYVWGKKKAVLSSLVSKSFYTNMT